VKTSSKSIIHDAPTAALLTKQKQGLLELAKASKTLAAHFLGCI